MKVADQQIQANEKAGRITQAQATTRLSKVKAKVTQLVDTYQVPAARCQRLQSGAGGSTTPTTGSTT